MVDLLDKGVTGNCEDAITIASNHTKWRQLVAQCSIPMATGGTKYALAFNNMCKLCRESSRSPDTLNIMGVSIAPQTAQCHGRVTTGRNKRLSCR